MCSLDHIRRAYVASRLAELARTHQVVVATHDVAFVAELKREAEGLGIAVGERCVARSRAGERKPGRCSDKHPWKTRDVPQRLDQLRSDLAPINKENSAWDPATYEKEAASWAGNLSETWERIFSQEVVGRVLAEGGLEVRPAMVKVLSRFSEVDEGEFQASYSRVSQWARRHDKSAAVNYVPPDPPTLQQELDLVARWLKRVKGYQS